MDLCDFSFKPIDNNTRLCTHLTNLMGTSAPWLTMTDAHIFEGA